MVLSSKASHWDVLPVEVKELVFDHASPLTLLVNGRLKPGLRMDGMAIHSLWMEAFDIDWQGDLILLPNPSNYNPLENHELAKVKSRSMYERLCQRLADATEANTKFIELDTDVELNFPNYHDHSSTDGFWSDEALRLLHVPMRHMWLDVLGDALDKFPYARANDCIIEGHADLLRHLVDTGKVDLSRIKKFCKKSSGLTFYHAIDVAAEKRYIGILEMLHASGCQKASTNAMDCAAKCGHLDVVKWLHENRTEGCTTRAMNYAAQFGHLKIIQFLHENRTEGCTTNAMDWAAMKGYLDVVKFLHHNRTEGCTTWAMDYAAWIGNLDVIKFLHEHRSEGCTTGAMDNAAKQGHIRVIRFLLDNRSEGFTGKAIGCCKTLEIAKLLISTLSFERKCRILTKAISREWFGPGVDALRKSLECRNVQRDRSDSDDGSTTTSDSSISSGSW